MRDDADERGNGKRQATGEAAAAGVEDAILDAAIRRARRAAILRNVGVSAAVTLVLVTMVLILLYMRSSSLANRVLLDIGRMAEVTGPDVYLGGTQLRLGLLGGEVLVHRYKLIEGVPVAWSDEIYDYNLLGLYSRPAGCRSPIQIDDASGGVRSYDSQTAQREMLFYHPSLAYANYFNDLALLAGLGQGGLAEIALSLDRPYSLLEIKSKLPERVNVTWCWVDTFGLTPHVLEAEPEDRSPYPASWLYGFAVHPHTLVEPTERTEADFVKAIEDGLTSKGKSRQIYRGIYNSLRPGRSGPLGPQDVRILGVVVTGAVEDLQKLKGQPYIRAAVLGVTARR